MSYTVCVYPVRQNGEGWEYLVMRRARSHGGFWQGVTGLVERGEEIEKAALRELHEETGFVPLTIQPIEFEHEFYAGFSYYIEHVFLAYVPSDQEPILSREHDAYRWCCFEDAVDLLYYPGNIDALHHCHSIVTASPAG